jgi:hypothetical protein
MMKKREKMKTEQIKNNKWFLFFLLIPFAASCSGDTATKLRMELPRPASIDMDAYKEIMLADFIIEDEKPDFDLNHVLVDYFSESFRVQTQKDVQYLSDVSLDEERFKDPGFWKQYQNTEKKRLIVTGTVSYQEETRKALIGKDKRQFENPFPEQNRLMERKFFNIKLDLYFIDPDTGAVIFQTQFDEKDALPNPNQSGEFAFYDLIIQIKDKLFRRLFGLDRVQERYLITK